MPNMRRPTLPDVLSGGPPLGWIPDLDDVLIRGTAVFDTGLATALSLGGIVPLLAGGDLERLRAELPFYRDLSLRGDPAASFPAPLPTPVKRLRAASRPRYAPARAQVSTLEFESPFEPVNPAAGTRYLGHRANRDVCVQLWQHGDRPRSTVLVLHGFGVSQHGFNSSFLSLSRLFHEGHDIVLYVLPFHGARASHPALRGSSLFLSGLAHFNEAIGHAIHDLRIVLDALQADGVQRISATGFSLGGYVAALLASVDPRLAAVAPVAPVADIHAMWRGLFPLNQVLRLAERDPEVGGDALATALRYSSPLSYQPLVPPAKRLIVGGLGDRLTPPGQARALWRHWGQPELQWFPGGHTLHFRRGRYQRALLDLFGSVADEPATTRVTRRARQAAA
jgi:pimeloyl-ACP methyl ester carboxylesterase